MTLGLEDVYRSSSHRIGPDLVGPLLGAAKRYDRAAGFFASSVFRLLRDEFATFFSRGGVMRLACSPRVSRPDAAAFARAVYDRRAARARWKEVDSAFTHRDHAGLLSWLIAQDLLTVQIVLQAPGDPNTLYHEKIAVFTDSADQVIALTGSANESATGFNGNFERVEVFRSWSTGTERLRARWIEDEFRLLWSNDTNGLEVISLAEACRRRVWESPTIPESPSPAPVHQPSTVPVASYPEALVVPATLTLFPHQQAAIRAWAAADGQGILEVATGGGKTIIALMIASRVATRLGPGLVVVIVAPHIHLVDQWCDVAAQFGLQPIRCAESRTDWSTELDSAVFAVNAGHRPVVSVATTGATMTSPAFRDALRRVRRPLLLIADEVHNCGAPAQLASLPPNAQLRLGLSATPTRWMDPSGTAALAAYFGPVVYRYSLEDAIRDNVLTHYRYFPSTVPLDDDELEQYAHLTDKIRKYTRDDDPEGTLPPPVARLLIKRARVLASARAKLSALASLLQPFARESHILVYCGDGSYSGPTPDGTRRQVKAVVQLIGNRLQMNCAPYTAETPPKKRRELLNQFSDGFLQVLVAIRCLDEGVDIPVARTAFVLASSSNPRQFVQRRGRLLRRAPGKSRADIYDLFVVPSYAGYGPGSEQWRRARAIVRGQLRRAREFADLADNGPSARGVLLELVNELDLLSMWGDA